MSPSVVITEKDASATSEESTRYKYTSTKKLRAALLKAGSDFRSDVVTVPTESMMQAIIDASFGDDIYDIDGDDSVNALQDKVAEMTGKEAALWAASGTMANQICLRAHLFQPPHTVLVDHRAHVQCWESGALPVFSQASVTAVHPANGIHLTVEDVRKNMIAGGNIHFPPTRVVSLENTMNGTILPLRDAQEISKFTRNYPVPCGEKPVAMHLDGARIFDGVIGEGIGLKDYCACFDSISICLAKGVGAPMGSLIVGSREFVERCKYFRKMFGGGIRQPGMMAAAASAALDYAIPRMANVHKLAKETAKILKNIGYKFALPVETNMIILDLEASQIPPAAFLEYCEKHAVSVFPTGRLVFHHQTSKNGVDSLVAALRELWHDKERGKPLTSSSVSGGYA